MYSADLWRLLQSHPSTASAHVDINPSPDHTQEPLTRDQLTCSSHVTQALGNCHLLTKALCWPPSSLHEVRTQKLGIPVSGDTYLSQETALLLTLDMDNDFTVSLVNADVEIQLLRDFICSTVFPEVLQEVP